MSNVDKFYDTLSKESKRVLLYEDPILQRRARELIPVEKITQQAREVCGEDHDADLKDALVVELLQWFKSEFFSWFDAGHCVVCDRTMQHRGMGAPTEEDLRFGAGRVEIYRCEVCGATERFPRYNDPGKLLESRRGRCGEWANCFTLMCRSLQFEARYVLDWTDHVWTEVYSTKQQRWLHCDSCEASCDKPLTYEAGWGKKLTYVISFSRHQVQDVTWRYTTNHGEVLKRRNLVPEAWLLEKQAILSTQLQSRCEHRDRERLTLQLIRELSEMMLPKQAGHEQGRTSGSLNWRKARGELGSVGGAFVWTPSESELNSGEFSLEYSASLDKYVRRSDNNTPIDKWSSGVFHCDSVFRKVEYDWNTAYLARTEQSDKGAVSWKFDLSSLPNLSILQASVSCPATTFHDGRVTWKISTHDRCQVIPNGCVDYEVDLTGAKWCLLSVQLDGGRGDQAWQHAQICRQSTKESAQRFPLTMRVFFGSFD